MEYDNDRIRRSISRTEIAAWTSLVLLGPLVTICSSFPYEPGIWPALITVNLLLFPVYFFYSRIMGTVFLVRSRNREMILFSLLTFLIIHSLLYAFHYIVRQFPLSAIELAWFTRSPTTILRESIWIGANMGFAMAIFYIRRAMDEKEALDDAKKDSTFFKLRYFRSQLNPHFLFNTLNSIYSLSLQRSDKTPELVVRLADIMRYLIYECDDDRIPLEKEIGFIRNYIEIERIRHKADIRFSVEGNTEGIMIEPYLFVSFVENGFKHAMDTTFDDAFIYITLKAAEGQITLNVINSTSADLESQAKRMSGKGIANSRSLLEILYPSAYELDIIQTEKEENRNSQLRIRNARERLESLYPDTHTLNVILSKSAFTVSLIIKSKAA